MKKRILALFMVCGTVSTIQSEECLASYPINLPPDSQWKTCVEVLCTSYKTNSMNVSEPPRKPISDRDAVDLALFAARQLKSLRKKAKNQNWQQYRIFVFNDKKAADEFQKVLDSPKRVEPLTEADYPKLTGTWKRALVCVAVKAGASDAKIYYPHSDPANWWKPLVASQKPAPKTQPPAPK